MQSPKASNSTDMN